MLSLILSMLAGWFIYRTYIENVHTKRGYECSTFLKLETPALSMPMVATVLLSEQSPGYAGD